MESTDCSRRLFLKKFALLSAGSLMLGATALACYGPMPNTPAPTVSSMSYVDAQSRTTALAGSQSVPAHTKFIIEFSQDMNTSAPTTIFFTLSGNIAVDFSKTWENAWTLNVVPSSDLLFNTEYTLRVGDDAENYRGSKIVLTETATAVFITVNA